MDLSQEMKELCIGVQVSSTFRPIVERMVKTVLLILSMQALYTQSQSNTLL